MENKENKGRLLQNGRTGLKKDTVEKYNKMVSNIENAKIYDGRGTYDLYECGDCRREKMTTYADKGVTPFCITCECGETMQHTRSFKSIQGYVPPVEKWIRPTLEQLPCLSSGDIDHVINGGLLLESYVKNKEQKSAPIIIHNTRIGLGSTNPYVNNYDKQPWRKKGKNSKF